MSSVNVLPPAADTALPAVEIESLAAAKPALFELGQVVHTAEIGHWAEQYLPNELLVDDLWLNILVMAHVTGCWDELPAEDRALNLRSLKKGEEGRIQEGHSPSADGGSRRPRQQRYGGRGRGFLEEPIRCVRCVQVRHLPD